MRLVYAHESVVGAPTRSLFLGGPSPREASHLDWRKNARVLLHQFGFDGYVYIPLPRDGEYHADFDQAAQIDWELAHLNKAGVRVFWVPRDLATLPGFTTNVEFGRYSRTPPCILGYPLGAPKMFYLHHLAGVDGVPVFHTLDETLKAAIDMLPV